jgi:hypothetical protein
MKILTYNTPEVNNLISNKLLPDQFLNEDWQEVFAYCQRNNFSSHYFMYDRTGAIPHFLNIDSEYSKIPTGNCTKSFKHIAEERAKYLISLGKPINVSWSGGLDSTFVLFCLLNYATDKDQVTVYGTYNSVIESGYMFDRYIKDRISYKIKVNSSYKSNYENNELYVTGQPSNLLFQPSLPYKGERDSILKIPNTDFIAKNASKPFEDVIDPDILQFLEPSIKRIGRPLKTLQDLRWFINFNFCWYNNTAHHNIGVNNPNIIPFFDTEDFQRWSIYNKDEPTKIGDYSDERWQIRELIAEYTGDKLYAKTKRKNVSVLSSVEPNWFFLLSDYSNIYLEDMQNPSSVSYK